MGKEELESLKKMYQDQEKVKNDLEQLYKESQKFVNDEDLNRLETFAKRVRGEILFARAWLLCEGQTEYLLINYFAKKMGKPLDYFGITVIDFQNNGSPDIFIALAITYDIPWIMITDSDSQGLEFSRKPKDRGFTDEDIKNLVHIIPIENASLEEFLVKNGFSNDFYEILKERGVNIQKNDNNKPELDEEIIKKIKSNKVIYIDALIEKLNMIDNNQLLSRIPKFFSDVINQIVSFSDPKWK